MAHSVTLRLQLDELAKGNILSSSGGINKSGCWNFYDWFCKDSSLESKGRRLMRMVSKFIKANPDIDIDKHYTFFKNNCPMCGPLYDDFRICDCETGDVIFNVTPKSGHTGKAEVYCKSNGFGGPFQVADTFTGLLKPARTP
jgi:hypothetical protein